MKRGEAAEGRHEYKKYHIQILLREMVMNILSRLPIYSLFQCTLVAKEWREIVTRGSHFATTQQNQALKNTNNILGLLLYTDRQSLHLVERGGAKHRKLTVMDAVLTYPYHNYLAVGSCNGLLCFFVWHSGSYVCNPISREIVCLPSLPSVTALKANASGFGFDSATNKYKVVQVFEEDHFRPKAKIHALGTEAWRELENVPMAFDEFSYQISNVLVNGCLDWCGHKIIMSLDMGKEQFGMVRASPNLEGSASMRAMAWKGHLSLISFIDYNSAYPNQILVMKEYNPESSWTPLFNVRWLPSIRLNSRFSTNCLPLDDECELDHQELDVLIKNLCSRDPYFSWAKAVTHIGSLVSLKTITGKVNEMKFSRTGRSIPH